jgi:hypothetical protein
MEKAARAGWTVIFIGLENINPESLLGTETTEQDLNIARCCYWRQHNVITYAGYILGFPTDTPESIALISRSKKEFAGRHPVSSFHSFDFKSKLGHDPTRH